MIDWVCEHWDQPDEGIWETRGGRKNFTYGRFQSWVALDRGIRLAERHGRPADITRWRTERDQVYRQVMERGFNPEVGAFTQHYGTRRAGLVAAADAADGLRLAARPDVAVHARRPWTASWSPTAWSTATTPARRRTACAAQEGTFSLCTFWYVDALARSGRLEEAQLTFEKMHTYANHVGLYSEEIGVTGEQLGNFPQAFSHLSLINAAINLDYQLDHGAGSVDRASLHPQPREPPGRSAAGGSAGPGPPGAARPVR